MPIRFQHTRTPSADETTWHATSLQSLPEYEIKVCLANEQLFISVRLGPVEIIPGVSEMAMLRFAQDIQNDAL